MSTELKPCPFCGMDAHTDFLQCENGKQVWFAGCDTDNCFGNINICAELIYETEQEVSAT